MSKQRIISCSLNEVKESDILDFFDELKRETHASDSKIIKDALRCYAEHYESPYLHAINTPPSVPNQSTQQDVRLAINHMLANSGQLKT